MKKSKVWGASLLLSMALGLTGCSFWSDEKDPEIVPDPMAENMYFIEGTVYDMDTRAVLPGATVTIADETITTGSDGTYLKMVTEKKTYAVDFSKESYLGVNADAVIASNAPNHSVLNLSVYLSKKGEMTHVDSHGMVVGNKPTENASEVTITIPEGALHEGETADLWVIQYQQPLGVTTQQTTGTSNIAALLDGLYVESNVTNFEKPLTLTWRNICSSEVYFKEVTVWSKVVTRAAGYTKEGNATATNGNYHFETAHLKSNYILEVYSTLNTGAPKTEANKVNGEASVKVDNSGSMTAIKDYALNVELKQGWTYTTTPEQALTAIGITGADITNMASTMTKIIENVEATPMGLFTAHLDLKTSISGGHVMYYRSDAKYCDRTYTFDVVVKGGKNQQAVVKVKKYTGSAETYYNVDSKMHSGGKM